MIKDGWYLIKKGVLPQAFEAELPPTRCVYIEDGDWFPSGSSRGFRIEEDQIESPAFAIGEKVLVKNDAPGSYWQICYYNGYLWNRYPHHYAEKHKGLGISWEYCKKYEEHNIEINVKINGKEAKLSDISEETLKELMKL